MGSGGCGPGPPRAAVIVAGTLTALAVLGFAHGRPAVGEAELTAAGLLLAARRMFPRGAGTRGAILPAALAMAAMAGAWGTEAVGLLAADRVVGLGAAAPAAGGWLLDGGWWLSSGTTAAIVLDVLAAVALTAGALALRALLRPSVGQEGHTSADHRRAAVIVREHATDSLDPFALRADKAFHFAHGGVLAYRVLRGTAVVAGDPIGPPGTAPAILESFATEATRRGWSVALTAAGPRHLAGYRALGFRTLCIGQEAVVDPACFSLEGGHMRSVRKAIGRQRRRGWTIAVARGEDLDAVTVGELAEVERGWRAAQPRLTGFAMTLGRLWGAAEDGDSLYVTGRDPAGTLRAFVRFAEYRGGLSLDVMRRVGETPNGLTESLVAAAIEHARELRLDAVSLNFAGFAHVMSPDQPLTRRLRIARWLLVRSHDRFQLERLVMFNKKFRPRWERRYLVHQGALDLPVVGLRVLQAEAYVRAPRQRPLSQRWEPAALPVRAATATAVLPLP